MDMQVAECLISIVEDLLEITKEQNRKLEELDACLAEERIEKIESEYNRTMKEEY